MGTYKIFAGLLNLKSYSPSILSSTSSFLLPHHGQESLDKDKRLSGAAQLRRSYSGQGGRHLWGSHQKLRTSAFAGLNNFEGLAHRIAIAELHTATTGLGKVAKSKDKDKDKEKARKEEEAERSPDYHKSIVTFSKLREEVWAELNHLEKVSQVI